MNRGRRGSATHHAHEPSSERGGETGSKAGGETDGATGGETGSVAQRKSYSDALVLRVGRIYGDFCAMGEAVTISALARRAGVSRATVRAILRAEFGWTPAQSQSAHAVGRQRGHLVQAVAGHPGLVLGRSTLAAQGWPNLRHGRHALAATGYPSLRHGRAIQAAVGWPRLHDQHRKQAEAGYPQLEKGRRNLAVRGWPNWTKAQAVLVEQDYLPLVEARLLTLRPPRQSGQSGQTPWPQTDRRILRGRTTRLAIVEALEQWAAAEVAAPDAVPAGAGRRHRITGRQLAKHLQLHPMTVYRHLHGIRAGLSGAESAGILTPAP